MVDLEKLRVFYHVAVSGSLLSANKSLDLTSPAISKHIKDLEDSLHTRLFKRKDRGMQLTDEGHRLFAVAKHAVPDLENIVQTMRGETVEQDVIRIVTTPGTLGCWALQKLVPLMQRHPQLKFKVYAEDEDVNFSESKADVGILIKVSDPEHVSMKKIMTAKLHYYASPAYIKRKGLPKNIDDLKNHDVISFYHTQHGSIGNIDWHLKAGSNHLDPKLTVDGAFLMFIAAVEGYGLVACPDYFELLKPFQFISVFKEDICMDLDAYMVFSANKLLDGILKEVYDCLVTS